MKKLFLVMLALVSFNLNADDLPVASYETIMEFVHYCMDINDDRDPEEQDYKDVILACVNEELEATGYQPIAKLPQ